MIKESKHQLFFSILEEMDICVSLINEYDSLLHNYGGEVMFQAESQMIKVIGNKPGITAAELAKNFNKTNSACSQLIRKLKQKNWVMQVRNKENSREYNLYLTPEGEDLYKKHHEFETSCYERTFNMLNDVSEEEMECCLKIQKKLNESFQLDVIESKEL